MLAEEKNSSQTMCFLFSLNVEIFFQAYSNCSAVLLKEINSLEKQ